MAKNVIATNLLYKSYGRMKTVPALAGVSVSVPMGSVYGLVGDNGAGKTTLLRLIAGLTFADSGEIALFGKSDPAGLNRGRRRLGQLIEHPGFYPNLTVAQQLEYYRIQRGVTDRKAVAEAIDLVGLAGQSKNKCGKLSLGQTQRLGIAIALIGDPEILLLDEPINGIDPSGIVELRQVMRDINQHKNVTIVISSHILSELEQLATQYGFLSHGQIMEEISARELKRRCVDCIEITVSDPAKFTALLDQQMKDENYKVLPSCVRVLDPQRPAAAYARLASDHDIDLSELRRIDASLEDYYLNLKKAKDPAALAQPVSDEALEMTVEASASQSKGGRHA